MKRRREARLVEEHVHELLIVGVATACGSVAIGGSAPTTGMSNVGSVGYIRDATGTATTDPPQP